MHILIIGCNGQLGFELCRKAIDQGFTVAPCDLPEFDITDFSAVVEKIGKAECHLVVNAAAYTAVDRAEQEKELAYSVNCTGPYNLALICSSRNIPLIHVSTDYVFDGTKDSPYQVSDPISPVSAYGQTKADGEQKIRTSLEENIIIRTAWLYGVHGNNFVKTMLRLGEERESIGVVCDQIGCPTNAADLAEAILQIAESIRAGADIKWGTYHYTGQGKASWHEFAEAIFDSAKRYKELKVKKVEPITTDQYPTPAKRPKNSVLDCSLIESSFPVRTKPWRQSLDSMIEALFSAEP